MNERQAAVAALVAEGRRFIAGLATEREAAMGVVARMDAFDLSAGKVALPEPQETPVVLAHLDAALALASAGPASAVAAAIARARPCLHWITYDAYPAAIGPRFPTHHAFSGLIGEHRMIPADDFAFGLFLIAPRTLYRDHRHPAPELYVPLTGPTRWRFGPGSGWQTRQAGEAVWNDPHAVHATLVEDAPFLCFYAWTRDIARPAEVVAADDWDAIEARL